MFIFSVEVSGGRSLERGRGWSGKGGRWGERPPGEVAGGRGGGERRRSESDLGL